MTMKDHAVKSARHYFSPEYGQTLFQFTITLEIDNRLKMQEISYDRAKTLF